MVADGIINISKVLESLSEISSFCIQTLRTLTLPVGLLLCVGDR